MEEDIISQRSNNTNQLWYMVLFSILALSCKTNDDKVSIEIYTYHSAHDSSNMYTIKQNDIVCVDWRHQSFRINMNVARHIDSLLMQRGLTKAFVNVMLDGEKIYHASIVSEMQSSLYDSEAPFVFYTRHPASLFAENWLIINYTNCISNKEKIKDIFNMGLYRYLATYGMLSGNNWECGKDVAVNLNSIDSNFQDCYKAKFR